MNPNIINSLLRLLLYGCVDLCRFNYWKLWDVLAAVKHACHYLLDTGGCIMAVVVDVCIAVVYQVLALAYGPFYPGCFCLYIVRAAVQHGDEFVRDIDFECFG